jgi:hypothetical protein
MPSTLGVARATAVLALGELLHFVRLVLALAKLLHRERKATTITVAHRAGNRGSNGETDGHATELIVG